VVIGAAIAAYFLYKRWKNKKAEEDLASKRKDKTPVDPKRKKATEFEKNVI
jgi:hypothetical protein